MLTCGSKLQDVLYLAEHPACAGCGEEEDWGEKFTLIGRHYFCDGCKAERAGQRKEAAE